MTWLVESPWPSLMLGACLEAILVIFLVRGGRALILGLMAFVLVATVGMVLLERFVVTEPEEVEDTLDAITRDLAANDAPAVLAHFSPQSIRRGEVQSALSRAVVRAANVGGDLEIRINHLTIPPSATTWFTGHLEVKDKRGEIPYEHLVRKFKVTLRKEDGRWLIYDYADADPRGAKGR